MNSDSGDGKTTILGTVGREFYKLNPGLVDMSRPFRSTRALTIEATPQKVCIDLNKTALIAVDMQNAGTVLASAAEG